MKKTLKTLLVTTGVSLLFATNVYANENETKSSSESPSFNISSLQELTSTIKNQIHNTSILSNLLDKENKISLLLNGSEKTLLSQPKFITDILFVNVIQFASYLGYDITIDEISKTATLTKGDRVITASYINIENNKMIPLTALEDGGLIKTKWSPDTRQIEIQEYFIYTVEVGDNINYIAEHFGVTVDELIEINQLTTTGLNVNQVLQIPFREGIDTNSKPSKKNFYAGNNYEHLVITDANAPLQLLDWKTANKVFSIGTVAKVTDVRTGTSWFVKRTYGMNHADTEPLTTQDARIMREVWGGRYSWDPRAIIVEFNGQRYIAAQHSMPHSVEKIRNNGYHGHFCLHFLKSRRHNTGTEWREMQTEIRNAYNQLTQN